MEARVKVWISNSQNSLIFGEGKTQLLEIIDQVGSLSKASKIMGLDYKKAWLHIQTMEEHLGFKVIERTKGGKDGGGSQLTPMGKRILTNFKEFQKDVVAFADKRFKELSIKEEILNG